MKKIIILFLLSNLWLEAMERSPSLSPHELLRKISPVTQEESEALALIRKIRSLTPKELNTFIHHKGGITQFNETEWKGLIKNRGGIYKLHEDELDELVKKRGGIKRLTPGELEGFVRNRGGYTKLNCQELDQVNLRKFTFYPEMLTPFIAARKQRLVREKQNKLEQMKAWNKSQVISYLVSRTKNDLDCDELNILNDILSLPDEPLDVSKSDKTKTSGSRWPKVDFTIMKKEELDKYTETFAITRVETEFIRLRDKEIKQLACIDSWDRSRALAFITELLNKDSVDEEQWKKISCKLSTPLVELDSLIRPMEKIDYERLLLDHNQELKEQKNKDKRS